MTPMTVFGQTSAEDAIDDRRPEAGNRNKPEPAKEKSIYHFSKIAAIDIQRFAIAEHRDHQSQAHGGFRGRNDQHKENENLAADLSMLAGERHERQVHRVQHDFHRQQQGDDVAFQKKPSTPMRNNTAARMRYQ